MIHYYSKLCGGVLLVAGTTIGAAMLALPVATGLAGFVPAVFLFLISWAYFTYTALLMLEVNLWLGDKVNLITMAKRTLGVGGAIFAWATYLFLLYALTTAYVAGSGLVMETFVKTFTGVDIGASAGAVPLLFIFSFFVYHGTRHVDLFNRVLMIGLGISFILMIGGLFPQVDLVKLEYSDWSKALLGISVIATSFGYHIIIPSLTHYFGGNVRQLRLAILIGSAFPLIGYILWTGIALGIVPLEGVNGIIEGYRLGENGADLIAATLQQPFIILSASFFAFFAIVTSFLGVSLGLSDFLADGFKIEKTKLGRIALCFMTFIPPFMFTISYPRVFLTALEYAGAFGVVTLLGFLPALMVWRGRYKLGLDKGAPYRAPGGKWMLGVVIVLAIVVALVELAKY
jgi:tyrosine-specific transport protein